LTLTSGASPNDEFDGEASPGRLLRAASDLQRRIDLKDQSARLAAQAIAVAAWFKLPDAFPTGTEFFDVEGIPVSLTAASICRAWDGAEPRVFSPSSAKQKGRAVSESEFRRLVAQRR
jgi:hypothetical protein